ncbi:MAG: T9SS type A sorting domain-containing protein [Bacteroidota bacterium]|nr:T9SS type A sorting domain-containing protein [Bacteroidota bacterium]
MQGFFTRVTTAGTPGSFGLNNAVRVTSFAAQPSFNKTAADTRPQVKLRLQGSSPLRDETTVYFEQGATAAFDSRFDAYKLPNSTGLNVSSIIAGDELSVNGLTPLGTAVVTVPLNVGVPAVGSYTLNAVDLLNFGTNTQVFLLDTQTGARINLSAQPQYTFSTQQTAIPGRFVLSFGAALVTASTPKALADLVQLYPNPAHASFTLLLPAELSRTTVTASLYNQLGQRVAQRTLALTAAGASAQFEVAGLAPGVYALRLTGSFAQVVKRVVVE